MMFNKVDIEFFPEEFKALMANSMIKDMCGHYLKTTARQGDLIVINITVAQANDLAGWVAAEANHSESREESELLNTACDAIEACI